jgi:hypothetical protein
MPPRFAGRKPPTLPRNNSNIAEYGKEQIIANTGETSSQPDREDEPVDSEIFEKMKRVSADKACGNSHPLPKMVSRPTAAADQTNSCTVFIRRSRQIR